MSCIKLVVATLIVATTVPSPVRAQTWTLRADRIYTGPDAPPLDGGQIIMAGDKIDRVAGPSQKPASSNTGKAPQCDGGIAMAGFQNSHVHFTSDDFADAGRRPAASLTQALERLLTQYGFTTVFDITSDRDNTLALQARIEKGEVRGPRVLTVGLPLFPPQGLPVYISHFRKELLDKLPQPDSVDQARAVVRENAMAGTRATKLFLATPQGNGTTKRMSIEIARAAVEETHRRGQLVFAHPTDLEGVQMALDVGVDILAHPPLGAPAPWPESLLRQLRERHVSMIPTLKLLEFELAKEKVPRETANRILLSTVSEFGKFAAAGGDILFGTDVDYMTDYDPSREYELLAQAGMTPMQILASLTTAPAARWNEQRHRGRLAAGMDADIVVLDGDPVADPRNFAKVRCAIRAGEVMYSRASRQSN